MAPGRSGALPPDGGNGVAAVQQQIENGCVEDRFELERLSGRRGAGQNENAGADHGSDTESGQAPRTQSLAQLPVRMFRFGDQRVDTAGPEEAAQVRNLRVLAFTLALCHAADLLFQ